MEKRELLQQLPGKNVYATDESLIRWVEFTGEHAAFHNAMHSFLMRGLAESEVTCNFVGQLSETEYAALKLLEIPMTLTVLRGGDSPAYAYYHKNGRISRPHLLEETVIEEALLNMEDTGRYVWDILNTYFEQYGISLGQIDLHFGHLAEHFVVLGGELTPETMYLFDPATGKRLWNGEDGLEHSYEILMDRISGR